MYQPRRVADPIATAEPALTKPDFESASRVAARRAAPTLTDRLLSRGGITLATVTVAATAAAVVLGSNGGAAVALGASTPQVSATPSLAAAVAAAAAAPVPESAQALTADQLAAPAAGLKLSKKASVTLLSLTRLYTTGTVNVRDSAKVTGKLLGSLDLGVRVSATGAVEDKYRKVVFEGGYGWVLAANLSDAAPVEAAGTTFDPCPRGSAVEKRLRKDTIHIYRSVCALFPAVNSYGGWRSGGLPFHKNGRALDIMLTPGAESALGHRIANYLIAHAKDFNVDHIIFEQQIWTPSTPHWRHMADRGGINANHFNHVHVAIRA